MKNKKSIWLVLFCLGNLLLIKQERRAWKCLSKKKNKRGWLLIMEAFVSMMLLLGLSIYFIQKQTPKADIGEEIAKQARYLIKEAAHNNDVRNAVMGNNTCVIKSFVYQRLRQVAPYLNYEVMLCAPGMSCYMPYQKKQEIKQDIYADDYLFSANLTVFRPTILKLFLWMSEKGPSNPFTFVGNVCYNDDVYENSTCNSQEVLKFDKDCGDTTSVTAGEYVNPADKCYYGDTTTTTRGCVNAQCFESTQTTADKVIKDEKDYATCKYNNDIDEDCDGKISCFGGVPKDLTKRDESCFTTATNLIAVAKSIDGQTIYGKCLLAECNCLEIENTLIDSQACIDGFDNDGDGDWDGADNDGVGGVEDPECIPTP